VTQDQDQHWARLAANFEDRTIYVAGKRNIDAIHRAIGALALSGRVLELGCGTGTHTRVIAETAAEVVATDLSEPMVEAAQGRLASLPHVRVERQDATNLTYPDGWFDAVVMVNLLHIVPDPDAILTESRRVVKPDGQIVIASFTTDGMGLRARLGMIYRYRRAYGKRPQGARALTVDGTRTMIETAGFTVRDGRLIGADCKAVFLHADTA